MLIRNSIQTIATVAGSAALSGAIDFSGYSSGGFIAPDTLNATTKIAFKVSESLGGTFVPLFTSANALVEVTVTLNAAKGYALPADLVGFPFFKIWCQAAGVDVNQTGDKLFTILEKS